MFKQSRLLSSLANASKFLGENAAYNVTTYSRPTIVLEKGKNALLWDIDGNMYIDFSSGIAVTALGHANEKIQQIMADQAGLLVHSSNLFHNLWTSRLARELVQATRAHNGMSKVSNVFLSNSGTEANEAALKFARKYATSKSLDKTEIICFKNAFHGRTFGALSVTPNPKYQLPFAPLIPGVKVAEINLLESVKQHISSKTAAIIIEPIQGEGGVIPVSHEFLVGLRALADAHDVLVIYDEIQCGMGRTGKLWAHSSLPKQAHPDIFTTAKALGNGYPIAATLITPKVEAALKVGDHGTTYGGNPLGSRVASYVLSEISADSFLAEVERKSAKFVEAFKKLQEKYPEVITDVRGQGLLLGVQFSESPAKVIDAARELGLIVISAGNNVVRFVPALTIEDKHIEEGLAVFETAIGQVYK